MNSREGRDSGAEVPVLPPSDRCVVCNRSHAQTGGRRLVSQSGRGVLLCVGSDPVLGRSRIRIPEYPDLWLCLYGGEAFLEPPVRERALGQVAAGQRPWFCQRCGHRLCQKCGSPLRLPMGSDYLTPDGSAVLHVAVFPVNPGCINSQCNEYMPGNE
jgi:hypothetical protein